MKHSNSFWKRTIIGCSLLGMVIVTALPAQAAVQAATLNERTVSAVSTYTGTNAALATSKTAAINTATSTTNTTTNDATLTASKMLECTVSGAPDQDTAIIVAKSIIRSPLTKCAMFGEDANWGRILCAIGYAEADFDIDKVDVDLESEKGIVEVCRNGSGIPFSEEKASEVLSEDDIYINVNLNQGEASAKAWGCDLTYDYVKINGDYRS